MHRLLSLLVLLGAGIVASCTHYRTLDLQDTQTWAAARARAHDEEAKHPPRPSTIAGLPQRHLVMPGEMLSELAEHYRVPMGRIIEANRIKKPYLLYVGQVLTIPASGAAPAAASPVQVAARAPQPPRPPLPRPSAEPLLLAKGEPPPAATPIAATPIAATPIAATPIPAEPKVTAPVPLVVAAVEPEQEVEAEVEPPAPVDEQSAELTRRAAAEKPPGLTGDGFLWPVGGKVINGFGSKPNGIRNDGVDIAAEEGTPVLAAENGIVVYAGDAIASFGRMMLIRHADGFTTAYAHNAELLADVGDLVERGQVIAKVGATGSVQRPQLHFELRAGKQAIDPSRHLVRGDQVASSR